MAAPAALLRHCPLLLPQDREGTAYEGFVTAQVPGAAGGTGRQPLPLIPHSTPAGFGGRGREERSRRVCEAENGGGGAVAGPLRLRWLPAPGPLRCRGEIGVFFAAPPR